MKRARNYTPPRSRPGVRMVAPYQPPSPPTSDLPISDNIHVEVHHEGFSFVILRWNDIMKNFVFMFLFFLFASFYILIFWVRHTLIFVIFFCVLVVAQMCECWCSADVWNLMEFDGSWQLWLCFEGCWGRWWTRWTNGNSDSHVGWSSSCMRSRILSGCSDPINCMLL